MYVYMSCLNISLIDGRRARAEARAKIGAGFKSGLREPRVAKSGLLGVSSPYMMTSLEAKSPSSSLRVVDSYERFFQQVNILKQSEKGRKSSEPFQTN